MRHTWNKFIETFSDAESAGMALLIAIGGFLVSVTLLIHWITIGRYTAATTLLAALGAASWVCIRDYRRGRFSVLSGNLFILWILVTVGAVAFSVWSDHEMG